MTNTEFNSVIEQRARQELETLYHFDVAGLTPEQIDSIINRLYVIRRQLTRQF